MKRLSIAAIGIVLMLGGCGQDESPKGKTEKPAAHKILYYRNPMGLPDTSSTPKKDSMGMDYIPVYADEAQESKQFSGTVTIGPEKIQRLGVRTEAAVIRQLVKTIKVPGTIQPDQRRVTVVTPRFGGYVEKVFVSAPGEIVRKGQPLMRIYSPDLVQAQAEYQLALQSGAGDLAPSARQRLISLEVPASRLNQLAKGGSVPRAVDWPSPINGVVISTMAVTGTPFTANQPLYQLADLSQVWAVGEVAEQDLQGLAIGQEAKVSAPGLPKSQQGSVSLVASSINPTTRTGAVRVVLPNPAGDLRTDMYVTIALKVPVGGPQAVTVPESAVLDNGQKQVVLVTDGKGRFTPRPVQVGARADGYAEILEGVQADEQVVVQANFLLDAESNLKAALQGMKASGVAPPEQLTSPTHGQ